MGIPETRYAMAGDVHIAYQVIGDGPVDLVWVYGLASNIDVFWDEPSLAAFFRRLAEFSRLVIFDRRGCGLSDRGPGLTTPTLEERCDDIIAVLDALGSDSASIFGVSEGGAVAAMFAATHPERTRSIIAYGSAVAIRGLDHPLGWHDPAVAERFANDLAKGWGRGGASSDIAVAMWATSMVGDASFATWLTRYARQSLSRSEARTLAMCIFASYDLVEVLPAVHVPALVLFRRHDPLAPSSYGRRLASLMPNAEFVELDGIDHLPFVGDSESVAAALEAFLGGRGINAARERRLVTLLGTHVTAPAGWISSRGDDQWRELLAAHERDVHDHLARFGGTEIRRVGDGLLASFDGPARALNCALGIVDAAERRGLTARAAVHTGECEIVDGAIAGATVRICTDFVDSAAAGEILASGTVHDLTAGSGIRFGEARRLERSEATAQPIAFPVLRVGIGPDAARVLASGQANVFRLDGEYWTVSYRGLVATVRDSKGLRDICRLLAEPGREFHALDLAAEGGGPRVAPAGGGSNDVLVDERARREYQRRIAELDLVIDEATTAGDDGSGAAARAERDAIVDALAAAYGLGGRPRRTSDEAERARKAVTRRIRDAIKRVAGVHPGLGRHLDGSIHTGVFCRYEPDRTVVWSTTPTTSPDARPGAEGLGQMADVVARRGAKIVRE